MSDHESVTIAEPSVRRILRGWLAMKTMSWLLVIAVWAIRLLTLGAYAAYVSWRTRRAVLAGALDDAPDLGPGPAPSVVVRERGILGWIKAPAS